MRMLALYSIKGGVSKLVKGRTELDKTIRATEVDGLDLLPASFGSREMDQLLENRQPSHLRKLLKPISMEQMASAVSLNTESAHKLDRHSTSASQIGEDGGKEVERIVQVMRISIIPECPQDYSI